MGENTRFPFARTRCGESRTMRSCDPLGRVHASDIRGGGRPMRRFFGGSHRADDKGRASRPSRSGIGRRVLAMVMSCTLASAMILPQVAYANPFEDIANLFAGFFRAIPHRRIPHRFFLWTTRTILSVTRAAPLMHHSICSTIGFPTRTLLIRMTRQVGRTWASTRASNCASAMPAGTTAPIPA